MQHFSPDKSAPRLVASGRTRATTGNAVDAALVARIGAGDRLALQVFHIRHHARVRRFILRFVENEALADLLTHDVFLDVWRKAARFAGRGPVSTWLLCVARHKTIQAARSLREAIRSESEAAALAPINSDTTEGRMP